MRDQVPRWMLLFSAVVAAHGCGATVSNKPPLPGEPAPEWVRRMKGDDDHICGLGVSGAGFEDSPYPRILARERAIKNLAGVLGTQVEEAMVDEATIDGNDVQYARLVHVDEALIAKVDAMAEASYWLDTDGVGPYAEKNFVYAWACVSKAQAAARLQMSRRALARPTGDGAVADAVPRWIDKGGKRPDGRFCAVGYSEPSFRPEKTFENVIDDVRTQLATTVESLVSNYYEEMTRIDSQAVASMTVASSTALAKGVVVTRFWHDVNGIGPEGRKRSTYGFGCAYPMEIVAASLNTVTTLPESTVASVTQQAQAAFDELETTAGSATASSTTRAVAAPAP